jgi:tellurite resistance protein TerC
MVSRPAQPGEFPCACPLARPSFVAVAHGPAAWIAFVAGVLALIALDLGITGQRRRRPRFATALGWSLFYIALALGFGVGVWRFLGGEAAEQFYTAWLIEKSLSVDNLFIFLLVFRQLRVPEAEQHRVLTWGIVGALGLRAIMIVGGLRLLQRFEFLTVVLGLFLILSAAHAVRAPERAESDARRLRWVRRLERVLPLSGETHGGRFFVRRDGRLVGTLLLLALLVIEGSDIIFALDSIPAVFGVTRDPFIIFTSNVLALLGLRALFFALAHGMSRLRYVHEGLAAILALVGLKMCLSRWVQVPTAISLATTLTILAGTVVASLLRDGRPRRADSV